MSNVIWKCCKPDADGVVWNDLLDFSVYEKEWVVTYRDHYNSWHVMWRNNRSDQLVSKNITEEQLRINLKLDYILTRGEANNVR